MIELCPGGNTRKQTQHASRQRWHTGGSLSSRPGWFMVYGASFRTLRAVTQRNPVPKKTLLEWEGRIQHTLGTGNVPCWFNNDIKVLM